MIKFEIKNRFSGVVQFTAEVDCDENAHTHLKIGLAVKAAIASVADLRGADLSGAALSGADLSWADLSVADLSGADLRRADLSGGKNTSLTIARTRILPEGEIIGWKKCKNNIIAKLSIPSAARRSHAFGRKCRAEYVDVIELFGGDVGETSNHNPATEYRAGTRVTADSWDEDWTNECSHGIHFFITREEAEDYQ